MARAESVLANKIIVFDPFINGLQICVHIYNHLDLWFCWHFTSLYYFKDIETHRAFQYTCSAHVRNPNLTLIVPRYPLAFGQYYIASIPWELSKTTSDFVPPKANFWHLPFTPKFIFATKYIVWTIKKWNCFLWKMFLEIFSVIYNWSHKTCKLDINC